MEQQEKVTKEEIKQLEDNAIEKYEAPTKKGTQVTCYDCKNSENLVLLTIKRPQRTYKVSPKKNKNRIPMLDKAGNKIYFCNSCLVKRAKKAKELSK